MTMNKQAVESGGTMARSRADETITPKATILVVDDHPIVRQGVRRVIESQADWVICGEAPSASEAIDFLSEKLPTLMLVDISLQDVSGIELIKQVRALHGEHPRILVASMHDENIYAERALQAGAQGYIAKEALSDKLIDAIEQVLEGRTYLGEAMTEKLLNRAINGNDDPQSTSIDLLSDRELEVFELIGRGWTTKKIAASLHLSPKTVETYRQHIKKKLNLANTSELAVHAAQWALEQGHVIGENGESS